MFNKNLIVYVLYNNYKINIWKSLIDFGQKVSTVSSNQEFWEKINKIVKKKKIFFLLSRTGHQNSVSQVILDQLWFRTTKTLWSLLLPFEKKKRQLLTVRFPTFKSCHQSLMNYLCLVFTVLSWQETTGLRSTCNKLLKALLVAIMSPLSIPQSLFK